MEGERTIRGLCDVGATLARLDGGPCTVARVGGVWTARVGRPGAPRTVVITAGLHAAEILGAAAAIACIRAAKERALADVCFHVAPAIDLLHVERNAREVLRAGRAASLLELSSPRDLEHGLWSSAPEAEATRTWLESIGSIDAYLSFHAASCLSGGAFFYVQGEEPVTATLITCLRSEVTRLGIPLLARDPTPMPSRVLEPGFFTLQDLGRGALAHVHARFAPALSLVSEIPVGVVDSASPAEAYAEVSRAYAADSAAGRPPTVPARLVDPDDHVRCLVAAALHVGERLNADDGSPAAAGAPGRRARGAR